MDSKIQERATRTAGSFEKQRNLAREWTPTIQQVYTPEHFDGYIVHIPIPDGHPLQVDHDADVTLYRLVDDKISACLIEEKVDTYPPINIYVEIWADKWTKRRGWYQFIKADYLVYGFINGKDATLKVYIIPIDLLVGLVEYHDLDNRETVHVDAEMGKESLKVGILLPTALVEEYGICPVVVKRVLPWVD